MMEVKRVHGLLAILVALSFSFIPQARGQQAGACESENEQDCFRDVDDTARSASSAYKLLHRERKPSHLRALSEEVLFLSVGTTWYWLAREKNLVDWDRPSAKARFTVDVIRMDNNDFPINFTLHPWSGAAYYSAARTNGLSLWASAAYGVGACLAWEYGIEFREKVSFNDLISTPLNGISLGEFFSQLALYVNRPAHKPTAMQRAVGWLFGPLQAISDLFQHERQLANAPADRFGFSSYMQHAFRLHLGIAAQSAGQSESLLGEFGVDGAFINIPSFGRPGRMHKFVHDADFTRFFMAFVQGSGEREFDSYADLSLLGVYDQRIDKELHGGALFLGSTLGYRYRRSFFEGFRDEVSATHLPGFALEGLLSFGAQRAFRISYRLSPDFAAIRSLSYEQWQAANPDEKGKTVVEKHSYLYAFGVSSLLEVSVSLPYVQLGGRSWFAAYNSVEGFDRSQEELTADPKGRDRLLDAEAFLRLEPFGETGVQLEMSLLSRQRLSWLGGYETRMSLLRGSLRVGLRF